MLKFGHNLREIKCNVLGNAGSTATDAVALDFWLCWQLWHRHYYPDYHRSVASVPINLQGNEGDETHAAAGTTNEKIQEKYKDNREKLNQEMMELYRKNKVNPLRLLAATSTNSCLHRSLQRSLGCC